MSERSNELQYHDVDQQGSIVSGPSRRQLTAVQKVGVAGFVLVVLLALIWTAQLNKTPPSAPEPELPLPGRGTSLRPAPIALPPAPPLIQPAALPVPSAAPSIRPSSPERTEITPAESPIFAFSGGDAGRPANTAATPIQNAGAAPSKVPSTTVRPTVLRGAKASLLPNPDMLVTMGTIIPCTLQTAIDTQLAGYVKCVLPQDIRGTTGSVVLLDRGTMVVGKIQGSLTNGQDRAYVVWDRAETPDHAIIELASPATDELGRAGLPGTVNTHFWDRFGGAILLSVVQGSLQAGAAYAATAGGSGGTTFNSFQSNGQQLSNTSLQATINIPPTLEKNQGDNVAIFVIKDLDFSDIYSLHTRRPGYAK